MLRFTVFDADGNPDHGRSLHHAHLLSPDDAALPATITAEPGRILCDKPGSDAAALSLLFDAGDRGALMLRTCLLPPRERPYLLSLELARHRIMLFLNKLEEWLQCDLPADEPSMAAFENARTVFTRALAAERGSDGAHTPEQDRLAREALRLAIDASERLATLAAEIQILQRVDAALSQRASPTAPVNLTIGCAVARDMMSPGLQKVITDHFDFITKPMRWTQLEPEEGEFSFSRTDQWIEWAVRTGKIPVVAGPLIDFRPGRTPDWLSIWENDYESLREVVFEHLKRVVTRYRKAVSRWTVASGLHLSAVFPLSVEQILDLTRICVMVVKKIQPDAKVTLDIDQPFGERYQPSARFLCPLLYAEMVAQQGVAVDAFGLRFQFGDGKPGHATRDLMAMSALLDAYSVFDKPLAVTALGCPSGPARPTPLAPDDLDLAPPPQPTGRWRREWSPDAQADWLTNALTVALSKPYVQSVCWQQLYDLPPGSPGSADQEMTLGGLISHEGRAKPALRRLGRMRSALRHRVPPTRLPAETASDAEQPA